MGAAEGVDIYKLIARSTGGIAFDNWRYHERQLRLGTQRDVRQGAAL